MKEQLPDSIEGLRIVVRECLIEGPVEGVTLAEFFENRAAFIESTFAGFSREDYHRMTKEELGKLKALSPRQAPQQEPQQALQQAPQQAPQPEPQQAAQQAPQQELNLWFEKDLFCQINFWFILHLIHTEYRLTNPCFLILPKKGCEYSFGEMSAEELSTAFQQRMTLPSDLLDTLSQIWPLYQGDRIEDIRSLLRQLDSDFHFVEEALQMHLDRLPAGDYPGRPQQTLLNLIEQLGTTDFPPLFREFCRREKCYGFGDLQVRNMLEGLLREQERN